MYRLNCKVFAGCAHCAIDIVAAVPTADSEKLIFLKNVPRLGSPDIYG